MVKPEDEALAFAKTLSNKQCCMVKDWLWWDVAISKEMQEQLRQSSLSIIYAHHVIHDEGGRFAPGHYVRTSPLVTFHETAFFETSSTIYILIGEGTRKTVSVENLTAIY